MKVLDRFLRYVRYDTTSDPHAPETKYPSTDKQLTLLSLLRDELREMGLSADMNAYGYVTATLPANVEGAPTLCYIAHVDTSPAVSGTDVRPRVIRYEGGDILLDEAGEYRITEADNPELSGYRGQELVVTDGRTLLGADDKAGVAEIMAAVEYFVTHPDEPHGTVKVAFTPDEEIGRGTDHFDVAAFGADFGYTVDGGELGEIEYENFNAASGLLEIDGVSVHPGSAKGRMKNAVEIFAAFQSALPKDQTPATTEKYEGFYMPDEVKGSVEHLVAYYIIRDHDKAAFEAKKAYFSELAERIDRAWGGGCVKATVKDSYYNMAEIIRQHMHLIDHAKAAMRSCGVTPRVVPIRGGTDGARLSYEGLPCPNLSTGGLNFHGRREFIPVRSLSTMTRVLIALTESYARP
ncbi:MAG: peptidase T [Clostridia bacterium]|nr:peptidase T [Clostridia bacterium]